VVYFYSPFLFDAALVHLQEEGVIEAEARIGLVEAPVVLIDQNGHLRGRKKRRPRRTRIETRTKIKTKIGTKRKVETKIGTRRKTETKIGRRRKIETKIGKRRKTETKIELKIGITFEMLQILPFINKEL